MRPAIKGPSRCVRGGESRSHSPEFAFASLIRISCALSQFSSLPCQVLRVADCGRARVGRGGWVDGLQVALNQSTTQSINPSCQSIKPSCRPCCACPGQTMPSRFQPFAFAAQGRTVLCACSHLQRAPVGEGEGPGRVGALVLQRLQVQRGLLRQMKEMKGGLRADSGQVLGGLLRHKRAG